MTVCNMAIEAGARAGLIAVDQKTLDYVKGRPFAPNGDMWVRASEAWRSLVSDSNANFDRTVIIDGSEIEPQVTWGTSPEMVLDIGANIPDPNEIENSDEKRATSRALEYMGLTPGTPILSLIHI